MASRAEMLLLALTDELRRCQMWGPKGGGVAYALTTDAGVKAHDKTIAYLKERGLYPLKKGTYVEIHHPPAQELVEAELAQDELDVEDDDEQGE